MNRLGAMMALVVALALAATAAAAPAEPTKQRVPERVPEWVIDPPTGWREDAALTKQTLEEFNAGLVKVGTGRPTHVDTRVWQASDELSNLLAMWVVVELADEIERQVDAFDGGVLKGFVGSGKQTAQPQRVEGSQIIRDVRVDKPGGQPIVARMVRRYQPAKDGLRALVVICMSAEPNPECEAALDHARLTVAAPVALDYRDPTHNLAYALGGALGLVGFLAGGVWLGRIVLRRFG